MATYLEVKTKECERDMLSQRRLRSIRNDSLARLFPKATVSQFTAPIIRTYLERGDPTLKTYNNWRGLLSTFFKCAFQHEWIASNPIEKTPHHRINHRRGSAVTIFAERSAELMRYVEGFHDGALALSTTPAALRRERRLETRSLLTAPLNEELSTRLAMRYTYWDPRLRSNAALASFETANASGIAAFATFAFVAR